MSEAWDSDHSENEHSNRPVPSLSDFGCLSSDCDSLKQGSEKSHQNDDERNNSLSCSSSQSAAASERLSENISSDTVPCCESTSDKGMICLEISDESVRNCIPGSSKCSNDNALGCGSEFKNCNSTDVNPSQVFSGKTEVDETCGKMYGNQERQARCGEKCLSFSLTGVSSGSTMDVKGGLCTLSTGSSVEKWCGKNTEENSSGNGFFSGQKRIRDPETGAEIEMIAEKYRKEVPVPMIAGISESETECGESVKESNPSRLTTITVGTCLTDTAPCDTKESSSEKYMHGKNIRDGIQTFVSPTILEVFSEHVENQKVVSSVKDAARDDTDFNRLRPSKGCLDLRERFDSNLPVEKVTFPRSSCSDSRASKSEHPRDSHTDTKNVSSFRETYFLKVETEDLGAQFHIDKLPVHLLLQVFAFLPLYDLLLRASLVCKKWLHLTKDSSLWRTVDLANQLKVDDAVVLRLTSLSDRVVHFDISDSKLLTNEGLVIILQRCPQLRVLKLVRCHQLMPGGLKAIGCCQKLEKLYLDNVYGLDDCVLHSIGLGCPDLRFLSMGQCNNVTDEGLEHLAGGCRRLRVLMADHCSKVSDSGMRCVVDRCTEMECFSLMACTLSDETVRRFSQLKHLKMLDISNIPSVTKATIVTVVQQCPLLEVLGLSLNTCMDDACMEGIAKHGASLQLLHLVSCNLTDKALESLGHHCKKLRILDIGWCQKVTDYGVQKVSELCPLLQYLGLIRCDGVTAEAIEELMARFPGIKYSTFKLESQLLLQRARQMANRVRVFHHARLKKSNQNNQGT